MADDKQEKDVSIFSSEDKEIIKHFLLGGLALGGGTAAITSLINYFNSKKRDERTSGSDDDVIYVYKDREKAASALGLGVGVAGGTGAAMLTYALVKKLYTDFRLREAQEKLDKAQHIFIDSQGYKELKKEEEKDRKRERKEEGEEKEAEYKDGGRSPSFLEGAIAAPIAIPLLLTLASGIVTNEVLKHNFSPPKPKVKPPKKIEFVDKPEEDQEEYGLDKVSGYTDEEEDDAAEFLIRLTLENPVPHSDLTNLVKAAARGGCEALKDTVMNTSFLTAVKMVKGASFHVVDPLAEHLAISYLNKSARLKNCVRLVAAGEFVEKYPELYKQACNMDDELKYGLYKLAALMGAAVRAERSQELGVKAASAVHIPTTPGKEEDLLSELIARINKERQDQMEDQGEYGEEEEAKGDAVTEGDEYESSDTSGEEAGISDPDSPSRVNKLNFIRSGKTTRTYAKDQDKDVIDRLLSAD